MSSRWYIPVSEGGQTKGISDSGIDLFKADPVKSLTREMCQNSIDVRVDACDNCNKKKQEVITTPFTFSPTTAPPGSSTTYNPYNLVREVPENPNHYASISLDGNQQCVDCRFGIPVNTPDGLAKSIDCDIFHVSRSIQDTCIAGRVDLTTMTAGGGDGDGLL